MSRLGESMLARRPRFTVRFPSWRRPALHHPNQRRRGRTDWNGRSIVVFRSGKVVARETRGGFDRAKLLLAPPTFLLALQNESGSRIGLGVA